MMLLKIYLYVHKYWTLLSIPLSIFFEFSKALGETYNLNVMPTKQRNEIRAAIKETTQ